ncbi:response regulator [Bailinhaonella thermotolerans]|uniref:Response regulator n=1 Tax=Bailinhaonella thermotolerans TaxID=1070861 RepID=A0A3A4APA8_9ACTN|nr:response regulator [Bailinhaonella thermotolerans]RJL30861.1 response regulator [Bailinhaonella thermotolerans]
MTADPPGSPGLLDGTAGPPGTAGTAGAPGSAGTAGAPGARRTGHGAESPAIRVLVCDDHPVFAESLALVLGKAGCEVVAVVGSPAAAIEVLRSRPVDVCLLDLNYPGETALERLPEILAAAPAVRPVLLSGLLDPSVVEAGREAGLRGFAAKTLQLGEIVDLITRVHAGEVVIRPGGSAAPEPPPADRDIQRLAAYLTPREREVVTALVRGENTTSLARTLGVSRSTARTHVQSVLTKLGVHSQREAVLAVARGGLVSVQTGEWLA